MWTEQWGDQRPVGYLLRSGQHEHWIRFHSLPDSRGTAKSDADMQELLSRHRTLLASLSKGVEFVWVLTVAWSDTPRAVQRTKKLRRAFPTADHWTSVPDSEGESWTHVYVARVRIDSPSVDALLRLVAADGAGDVILTADDLEWLYHPYYAGGDVILRDRVQRDLLANDYAEWLPQGGAGHL